MEVEIFERTRAAVSEKGLTIVAEDLDRPWGGFFVLAESELAKFIANYFSGLKLDPDSQNLKMSPKILMVAPQKRLSWQYHHRRGELWSVAEGPVGVITSPSDQETPTKELSSGQQIQIAAKVRHRLIGLNEWGVVAEIWQHTDVSNPSDEDDIVRVEDDFGR